MDCLGPEDQMGFDNWLKRESKYDITITPPSRWYYRRRKLLRIMSHWYKFITNPTYRLLWSLTKEYR